LASPARRASPDGGLGLQVGGRERRAAHLAAAVRALVQAFHRRLYLVEVLAKI
jgi:hypothetical protein